MTPYYVIHSKDAYLLARFCMELQMEGIRCHKSWCEDFHPFKDTLPYSWLFIGEPNGFKFHNHDCSLGSYNPTRFTLTEKSYLKVLTEVLNQKL